MSDARLAILSDVHYACAAEQARGSDYEYREIRNPGLRLLCRVYRHYLWLRNPVGQNRLLDQFLERVGECDHVFALGDYTCDSAFVGVSDPAARESARECLTRLRSRFGTRLHALIGDHELGKFSLIGRRGGLRLESWRRALGDLDLKPFWQLRLGSFLCMGITSTLVGLAMFESEMLESEQAEWEALRREHLEAIRSAFAAVQPEDHLLLFCHDPSALPYLWEEPRVRERSAQIRQTFVGHLHSGLILWKSRFLAGMPRIRFLGHAVKRMSSALNRARDWTPFHVRLCPSLAGIELLKDGGFYTAQIDLSGPASLPWVRHRIHR